MWRCDEWKIRINISHNINAITVLLLRGCIERMSTLQLKNCCAAAQTHLEQYHELFQVERGIDGLRYQWWHHTSRHHVHTQSVLLVAQHYPVDVCKIEQVWDVKGKQEPGCFRGGDESDCKMEFIFIHHGVDDSSVFRRLILSQLVNRSGSNDFIKTPLHSTLPPTNPGDVSSFPTATAAATKSHFPSPLISSFLVVALKNVYFVQYNFYYVICGPCITQHSRVYTLNAYQWNWIRKYFPFSAFHWRISNFSPQFSHSLELYRLHCLGKSFSLPFLHSSTLTRLLRYGSWRN